MGDFNEILDVLEKLGWNERCQSQIQAFHDALSDCNLLDMKLLSSYNKTS